MDYASTTDRMLMWLVCAGNNRAFDTLCRRYYEPLFRLARRLAGDEDRAWDAVQDTWVRLCRVRCGDLAGPPDYQNTIFPWLCLMLRQCLFDRARTRVVIVDLHAEDLPHPFDIREIDPALATERSDDIAWFERSLLQLSDLERVVVERRFEGLTFNEITAGLNGPTMGQVTAAFNRGLNRLRALYQNQIGGRP